MCFHLQLQHVRDRKLDLLSVPIERVYSPSDSGIIEHLKLGVYSSDWEQNFSQSKEHDVLGEDTEIQPSKSATQPEQTGLL